MTPRQKAKQDSIAREKAAQARIARSEDLQKAPEDMDLKPGEVRGKSVEFSLETEDGNDYLVAEFAPEHGLSTVRLRTLAARPRARANMLKLVGDLIDKNPA